MFAVLTATIVHPTRAAYTHPLYKEHLCKVSSELPHDAHAQCLRAHSLTIALHVRA